MITAGTVYRFSCSGCDIRGGGSVVRRQPGSVLRFRYFPVLPECRFRVLRWLLLLHAKHQRSHGPVRREIETGTRACISLRD